jgi:DNA-binding CsgD family transcriptional regulator
MALADLELSLGRLDPALEHLTALAHPETHLAFRLASAPDLVEVSVRLGRASESDGALAAFEAWVTGVAEPMRPLVARCHALLAGDDAERRFEEALDLHRRYPQPYDRARTELLYGEHLRRDGRRVAARAQLRASLSTFEGLGAKLWAERAHAELRATGEKARRRDASSRDNLTPQELRVAELVATGASNRDVGARLFLSPKTVEYHLSKVFTKLGVTSRTELARVELAAEAPALL